MNEPHEHDYRFVYSKREWVPADQEQSQRQPGDTALFKSVEFALLMCRCTDVVKVEVKTKEGNQSGKKVRG
jgi:hypothetical protein